MNDIEHKVQQRLLEKAKQQEEHHALAMTARAAFVAGWVQLHFCNFELAMRWLSVPDDTIGTLNFTCEDFVRALNGI